MNSADRILSLLTDRLAEDYNSAVPMPSEYYNDEEWFAFEREHLLLPGWHCVGRLDEIPNVGDYKTFELLGESLLIVRAEAGRVMVFANRCRHRGSPLLADCGSASSIACPYHGWVYELDGSLKHAPFFPADDTRLEDVALARHESTTWGGFIYTCLREPSRDLAADLVALDPLVANYGIDEMTMVYSSELTWDVNWKLLVENYMEGYHLSVVHKETIHPYTPTRLCEHFAPGPGFCGYYARFPEGTADRGRYPESLTAEERLASIMFQVFPTHVAGAAGHLMSYVCINPINAGTTTARIALAFYDSSADRDEIETAAELYVETMKEDEARLIALQRTNPGRDSDFVALAPAAFEGTVLDNYHYAARTLGVARPSDSAR